MKELSIEEKARRYDEAIKRAQAKMEEAKVFDYDDEQTSHTIRLTTTDIFPELKEGEDERIMGAFRDFAENYLFWGKSGLTKEKALAWLEKQADHAKFINSIQVGDKVTRNQDGVLVNLSQLKRVAKPAEVQGEQKPVEPQQDMLSQEKYAKAVDECIYGERKPAWSEEDEKLLDNTIRFIENCVAATSPSLRTYNPILTGKEIPFLKSLKDRVIPQPKQEFSEYDEYEIDTILAHLKACLNEYTYSRYEKYLKSLRPQSTWKPSEEQILAINTAINVLGKGTINGKYLIELQEQLKKLREE